MSDNAFVACVFGAWAGLDLLMALAFWVFMLYKSELYRRDNYPDRPVTRDLLRQCRKNCRWMDDTPFDEMGAVMTCVFGPLAVAVALVGGTLYGFFWLFREFMYFMLIKVLGGDNAAIRQR